MADRFGGPLEDLDFSGNSQEEGILAADLEHHILGLDQRFLDLWQLTGKTANITYLPVLIEYLLAEARDPEQVRANFFADSLPPKTVAKSSIELESGQLLEMRLRPLWCGGKVTGRVWSLRDTSKTRRLQQRINQAQKMEAIGRLVGGISHDFNNLLTVIRGYCDLCLDQLGNRLKKAPSPRSLGENLGEISKAADRASTLTRQLLAYSRQQVVTPQTLDLNGELREIENMLTRVIGDRITLRFALKASPATIRVDRSQLQQMVMNLVINARDAMPDGGEITLETEIFQVDREFAERFDYPVELGPMVMMKIHDTGDGIDPELLPRIFEPFFTTKDVGRGTGLGLSTVYGIVKQSGGYIWVDSQIGGGTEFQICLPSTGGVAERTGTVTVVDWQEPSGQRILVVDDDQQVREVITRLLTDAGYRVQSVASAESALAAQRSDTRYDLLITDLVMSDIDGNELARRMAEKQGDLAVLFISGYDPDAYERRGVLPHGAAFLHKPLDASSLRRKVAEVLG